MPRRVIVLTFVCLSAMTLVRSVDAASDIVLRASDFSNIHGNWAPASDSSAADGKFIGSADAGWSSTTAPTSAPTDYFEATFNAPAGTSYHVWLRLRATSNSKYNDSVWVQYSDAVVPGGAAVYRIGTTTALNVNLERCSGCGVSGWGWQDGAYWLSQATTIQFAGSGPHTLRVQTREDGVEIDQIVLSSGAYLFTSPGKPTDDTVIVPLPGATPTGAAGPYLGTPVSLPGRVQAEDFDAGVDGVSYHDSTPGNAGGAYRQTDVDIENCSAGGYDVGWIEPGEWLNYSVNVTTAGAYTVLLRVASPSGGSLHLGFNGPSAVWKSVAVPATGGWQAWTTVSVPVTLAAGQQLMTLSFDTAGFNLDYADVSAGSTPTAGTGSGGSAVTVVAWNIKIDAGSAAHAQQAIDYMMAMTPRPQIVVIDEGRQTLYDTYVNELQARSGQAWHGVFRTHCPPGGWNGSACTSSEDEGVGVFSSLSVVDSGSAFLPSADQYHSARGVARLAVNVGGVVLQAFAVHLPTTVSARAGAMASLKSYASRYSSPQIVAGDFNADRNEIDPAMSPNFVDSWGQVGSGNGYTLPTPSPTMKLDYWLEDAGARAVPAWSVVVTTPGTFSDHYPIINSYTIK
jgi:endonuclease/exonuclease/phosphatase family metal-dependent hydrolase